MRRISRGTAHYSAPVNVNIDTLWELLADWGNLSWLDNEVEADEMVLESITLEGESDAVPRTRALTPRALGCLWSTGRSCCLRIASPTVSIMMRRTASSRAYGITSRTGR